MTRPSPLRDPPFALRLALPDAEATSALGTALAARLHAGDSVLLSGGIGAGKSHLARALIRAAQEAAGELPEEVPSPTFTLVQTYGAGAMEIVHADLYRLGDASEAVEIGLFDALGRDLCLVEWPDRLGAEAPADALCIGLAPAGDGRTARLSGPATWRTRLADLPSPGAPAP
mgnify:FL=1